MSHYWDVKKIQHNYFTDRATCDVKDLTYVLFRLIHNLVYTIEAINSSLIPKLKYFQP